MTLKDQNGILSKSLSLCCIWTSHAAEFSCFIGVFQFTYQTPTPYLEERLKLKELFHEFDDGRNCERVVAAIKELLLGLKDHNTEFAYETPVRTDQH